MAAVSYAPAMASAPRSPATVLTPRSLVLATDIDVLAIDHTITRRDGYLVVRSPRQPDVLVRQLPGLR